MRIKKEYILLVAVMIALVSYLIFQNPDRTQYELPSVPDLRRLEISKIEISKSTGSIVLSKKDNTWHLAPQGYPADRTKVEPMLDTVERLTLTTLVSESKNYARYHLSDDRKISVKAWAGEALKRHFEVGKAAPSFRHTFVKLAGDHRVYHARENFRNQFDQTVDDLRDKSVLSFAEEDIQEIHFVKGKDSMVFNRKEAPVEVSSAQEAEASASSPAKGETIWENVAGKKGDQSRLSRLLSTLAKLRCEKYLDDRNKDEFTNPIYLLRLKGTEEQTLSIFTKLNKEAKSYPAISSENDYPFLLPDWQVTNIMLDPDEVLAESKKPSTPS